MNFAQLFQKSNSSLNQLQGNVLHCSVSQVRGDIVEVDTGLAGSSVCFQSELKTSSNISKLKSDNRTCIIGIEDVESANGEPSLLFPKSLQKICRRKLVWTELSKIWRSKQNNRIKGFILNSVNGGYAVALAGHIAFLPRSLRLERKVHHSEWRKFSILSMNPKIGNIVVKESWRKASNLSKIENSKVTFLRNQDTISETLCAMDRRSSIDKKSYGAKRGKSEPRSTRSKSSTELRQNASHDILFR